MRYITLLFVIMSFSAQAQKTKECNPYFEIPKYELSDVKHYSMGYFPEKVTPFVFYMGNF